MEPKRAAVGDKNSVPTICGSLCLKDQLNLWRLFAFHHRCDIIFDGADRFYVEILNQDINYSR